MREILLRFFYNENLDSSFKALLPALRAPSQTIVNPSVIAPGSSNVPFYGGVPMEHSDMPPQAHATILHLAHLANLGMHQMQIYSQPITDVQVAHARLNKQGHRPLGRTQSAPLPLGHPMLTSGISIGQTHYENSEAERQAYEQQHMLLTQKIRQTVLTRSGANSREQILKEEDDTGEVIDLTDKKQPPKPVLTSSVITSSSQSIPEDRVRDHEYLQQQRELLIRQSMQVINR